VLDQAQALGLGAPIDLIPQLADPKDLYQLLKPATVPGRLAPAAKPAVQAVTLMV